MMTVAAQKETAQAQTAQMQTRQTLKEIIFFALSFLAPVLLMALIWGNMGITYGGQVTPLTYDMQGQYMPFYASLRYILSGENSIFFSWSFFLGSNFLGAYALDLASPLSWLTVLWDLEHMPDAIYVLTLLKIGLCGLSFTFFTRFGLQGDSKRRCGIANVIFSCCYALMSYNVMYSVFLPWLEEVMLLPLILLGIEKLLQGKKGFLYFISIAGAFICNYYISYMVGIFVAIYILCRVFAEITRENCREKLKALFRFGINTLLALGISMPLLLPALWNLTSNMQEKAGGPTPNLGAYAFNVLQLLQKFMPGHYDSMENWGLPSIYCGSIILFLAVVYFFQKKYCLREKISYVILLAVPFLGFLIKEVDYAWHGFQYPNSVPYRYAFLFSAAVLMLAWKAYVLLPMEGKFPKTLAVIAGCYLCVELFFNGFAIVSGIHKETLYSIRNRYNQTMDYCLPLVEEIREEEGFFRAESLSDYLSYNENMLFGLKGVSSFNSASNAGVQTFLYVIGTPFRYAASMGEGLSPVGDSLLGVKYRITGKPYLDGYEVKDISKGSNTGESAARLYLYENQNALSLGYMVKADSALGSYTFGGDVFENQNRILEGFGVEEPEVFRKIDTQLTEGENSRTLTFTALSDNPVYYYLLAAQDVSVFDEETGEWKKEESGVDVHLTGEGWDGTGKVSLRSAQYLGNFEKGEELVLEMEGRGITYYDIYVYELDKKKYEAAMRVLKEGEMEVTSCKGGHVTGTVTAKQGQLLFLSLTADEGYTVMVDEKPSNYVMVLGTFLGVPLTEGEHQIEITYVPPYFKEGMAIGLIAFALFVIYFGMGGTFVKTVHKISKNEADFCEQ